MILALFLIYAIIPIVIILQIPITMSKQIFWCRFYHALPAIVLTIINVVGFSYHNFVKPITVFQDNPYFFLVPGLMLAATLIIFNKGKKKERIIQTELTSQEIEKIRFNKNKTKQNQIVIELDEEEIEKL